MRRNKPKSEGGTGHRLCCASVHALWQTCGGAPLPRWVGRLECLFGEDLYEMHSGRLP